MSPLTIQVDIKNCSGLNNGPQHVHFTEEVLLVSAITVGRASLKHVLANGIFSQFEVKIKIYKIISYLQKDKAGNLYYTDAFESLDPSEKCGVSYFMGLVFTKLLANRFYNIRYLLHYDIYKKYLVPQSVRTNAMKPDLLGLSGKGMWNVFESKGRVKRPSPATINSAKQQANAISYVNSYKTVNNIASIIYADRKNRLQAIWDDPQFDGDRIDIKECEFLKSYYENIYREIYGANNDGYQTDLVSIGLTEEAKEKIRSGRYDQYIDYLSPAVDGDAHYNAADVMSAEQYFPDMKILLKKELLAGLTHEENLEDEDGLSPH